MTKVIGPFKRTGQNPQWAMHTIRSYSQAHNNNMPNDRVWVTPNNDACIITFDTKQKPDTLYVIEHDSLHATDEEAS